MATHEATSLEPQIHQWRAFLRRRQAIHPVDVAELEDHLREQIAGLIAGGLAADEAFLVAVRRMGALDELSREFAREHSERLWRQLIVAPSEDGETRAGADRDMLVAFCLALGAAALIKAPALFGLTVQADAGFYLRNLGLFVLPLLAGYFAWKRGLGRTACALLAAAFGAAVVAANAYPLATMGSTQVLTALHLPIALWLLVGLAYAGRRWRESGGRMDFIRFSGELFIYYVLIALGGGVLTAFMAMIFSAAGLDVEPLFESWVAPCGAVGAVLVGAWLVEAKQSVIENMAPVLARLFTPMFAIVLIAFLATLLFTGRGVAVERNLLIGFDLLLAVVLGLLLYSISARDPAAPPGVFDALQVVLVISALAVDLVALSAIAMRIEEFGVSPNRVAALGQNLILLVNLVWSAVLYIRFVSKRGSFASLERWQTAYLPVYAAWATVVVVVFPPAFGFL